MLSHLGWNVALAENWEERTCAVPALGLQRYNFSLQTPEMYLSHNVGPKKMKKEKVYIWNKIEQMS